MGGGGGVEIKVFWANFVEQCNVFQSKMIVVYFIKSYTLTYFKELLVSFEFDPDAAKSCKSLKCCQYIYSEKLANLFDSI